MKLPFPLDRTHCGLVNASHLLSYLENGKFAAVWRERLKYQPHRELQHHYAYMIRYFAAEARLYYDLLVEEVLANDHRI